MGKKHLSDRQETADDVLRYEESALYEEKIRRMESSIDSLRLSRRVLMSLLEQVNASSQAERERLLAENRRLRRKTQAYARRLWQANRVDPEEEGDP
ncbi:MAG: translation initiation factor 2 [Firmicutes bacterium]|nr:translation initiation factor 2 [Bacillota bacterium]